MTVPIFWELTSSPNGRNRHIASWQQSLGVTHLGVGPDNLGLISSSITYCSMTLDELFNLYSPTIYKMT